MLQKSDDKEWEQSERLDPIEPISDTNSNNHNKIFKLGAKVQNFNYKYNPPKITSLFAQNQFRIHQSNNHFINAISNIPRAKAKKSTPAKARVTFSDNSPSNKTPATNTSSNTETTPSTSAIHTTEDLRLTDTINRIFSKKLLAILNGKDAILKESSFCSLFQSKIWQVSLGSIRNPQRTFILFEVTGYNFDLILRSIVFKIINWFFTFAFFVVFLFDCILVSLVTTPISFLVELSKLTLSLKFIILSHELLQCIG